MEEKSKSAKLSLAEEMKELIFEHVPSWKSTSFKTENMNGWTNEVCVAMNENPAIFPQKLILRKFGGGAGFLDRAKENKIHAVLSQLQIGPQIYYFSEKHRIEQFLEGVVPDKTWYEKENYLLQVVASLARIHRIPYSMFFSDGTTHTSRVIRDWVSKSKENMKHLERFTEKDLEMLKPAEKLLSPEEIAFVNKLQEEMGKDPKNKVVSHTDTYNLNHICTENGEIRLIDFEYVMQNPRMYDIANFLNEYNTNYENDRSTIEKSKRMCKKRVQKMIKCYMVCALILEKVALESVSSISFPQELLKSEEAMEEFLKEKAPDWERQLDRFYIEYEMCTLLVNFNWAVWGIMLSGGLGVEEFDYLQFSNEKIKYYYELKKDLAF